MPIIPAHQQYRIIKNFIILSCVFLCFSNKAYATPDGCPCLPLHSEVTAWDKTSSVDIDFSAIKNAVKKATSFIPKSPEAKIDGAIEFNIFNKTACCTIYDDEKEELRKGSIGGAFSASVDSGQLPIPGLSIPYVVGFYVKAVADASVSIQGESEQECNMPYNKLSASFTAEGGVGIEGGGNTLGGWLSVGVRGSGEISGGGEWSEGEDPNWSDRNVRVAADVVVNGPGAELIIPLVQLNTTF